MPARNTVRARASIIETGSALSMEPRDPFENRLGADFKIPTHSCSRMAGDDPRNDKTAAVRTGLSIGVTLHDWVLSRRVGPGGQIGPPRPRNLHSIALDAAE